MAQLENCSGTWQLLTYGSIVIVDVVVDAVLLLLRVQKWVSSLQGKNWRKVFRGFVELTFVCSIT